MEERSEEQIVDRLFELENGGLADQRAELTGKRFLSLIQEPASGRGYVFRHGVDETEGAEVPEGTEFWEYPSFEEARRAFGELLEESRQAGELVQLDSEDDLGDFETGGAELRDLYAAADEDELAGEGPPEDEL